MASPTVLFVSTCGVNHQSALEQCPGYPARAHATRNKDRAKAHLWRIALVLESAKPSPPFSSKSRCPTSSPFDARCCFSARSRFSVALATFRSALAPANAYSIEDAHVYMQNHLDERQSLSILTSGAWRRVDRK